MCVVEECSTSIYVVIWDCIFTFLHWILYVHCPRVRQSECEAAQLWVLNAYVKNARSFNCIPPYVFTFCRNGIVGQCICKLLLWKKASGLAELPTTFVSNFRTTTKRVLGYKNAGKFDIINISKDWVCSILLRDAHTLLSPVRVS
jgi:hypothetical protein